MTVDNSYVSDSFLWEAQRRHYKRAGPFIWSVTNSAATAFYYARAIEACLKSWRSRFDLTQPVYILDLGAGAGRFSYLLVKTLRSLMPSPFKFCVVLVDHAAEYNAVWQANPLLQKFVESGNLDFCVSDLVSERSIRLLNNPLNLDTSTLVNPLIAIGNYLFDQIPCDAFILKDGDLVRGRWLVGSKQPKITKESLLDSFEVSELEWQTDFSEGGSEDPLPFSEEMKDFLKEYAVELGPETPFYFPWAALNTIQLLHHLAGGNLLFLCGDMGERKKEALRKQKGDLLPVMMHSLNLFALPVNFDLIGCYAARLGGWSCFSSASQRRFTVMGIGFGCPETYDRLSSYLNSEDGPVYPLTSYSFVNALKKKGVWLSLDLFLSSLEMSRYEPGILARNMEDVAMQIIAGYEADYKGLNAALQKVGENFFWAEKGDGNIAFKLAQLYYVLGLFDRAIEVLLMTERLCGETPSLFYYLGLAYQGIGDAALARNAYKKVLELNPEHLQARRCLSALAEQA